MSFKIQEFEANKWPELLRELPDKARPKRLYIKGTPQLKDALLIAVVGTRRPSPYGKDACYEIVSALAENGIGIVSGMAVGIDAIAHKTALEHGGITVAVLASGLNEHVMYPKGNIDLSRRIVNSGGYLVSEYEENKRPELWTFPQRNRIIAGISKAVVIIEAGKKSGALITARFAEEFNRELFALPGSIFQPNAAGTNHLIKSGAIPVTHPEDILEALNIPYAKKETAQENVSDQERTVLNALASELSLDEIIKTTKLPASIVLAVTSNLEIRGIIKSVGSSIYRKNI